MHWLHERIQRNTARQFGRGMLRCAIVKNALRQSRRKVEPDSTSRNASCNKNVARLQDCEVSRSIRNHLYWCSTSSTAGFSYPAKSLSVMRHSCQLSPVVQTGSLEGFHSVLKSCNWYPKMICFSWLETYCRSVVHTSNESHFFIIISIYV